MNRAIVVGVDGSQAAKPALTWAAGTVTERLRSGSETADTVVEMVESVVGGRPVPALAEASRAADLVVVGSRGLGGFTSAALGSVSHGILHRACCPVAVIGTGWRRS